MNKNLTWKLVLIVATLLIFLFGIFGIPQSFSGQGLLAAMTNRIHLGLDLRGGTHLILQVQVNDAVRVDAENAIEVLKEQLNKRKVAYADISQPDPQNNPDRVMLKGIPTEGRKELVDIVSERLSEYNLSSGADNTYTLNMKPQMLSDLKNKAVTQAIETIRTEFPEARIIVLTTYSGDTQVLRALKAGARGYVLKGHVHKELLDAIQNIPDQFLQVEPRRKTHLASQRSDHRTS